MGGMTSIIKALRSAPAPLTAAVLGAALDEQNHEAQLRRKNPAAWCQWSYRLASLRIGGADGGGVDELIAALRQYADKSRTDWVAARQQELSRLQDMLLLKDKDVEAKKVSPSARGGRPSETANAHDQ